MDYSEMTQNELLSERSKIDVELSNYGKREKIEVFRILIPFEGYSYFMKCENAKAFAIERIEIIDEFEELEFEKVFITEAECENLCIDNPKR